MDQIAVVNIRNGEIKPHGGRDLRDRDLEEIQGWLADRTALLSRYPTLDPGVGYAGSDLGRLPGELSLRKWRERPDDSLSRPVSGEPLEPGSLQLDFDEGDPPTPEPRTGTDH